MKLHKKIIGALLLLAALGSACNKAIPGYENDPRIYFYERFVVNSFSTTDVFSRSFSFAPFPAKLTDTTIYINVKIMGKTAATDRTFYAEPAALTTNAIPKTDYELLPGTVKANEMMGTLPVILHRTAEMKTVIKEMTIKIADRGDFKTGPQENSSFKLIWNDDYLKPDNWDTFPGVGQSFGTYSVVKYKFIIDVLGLSQFPLQTAGYNPAQYSNAQMLDFKAILKNALLDYNNTHATPLRDEFGLAITFP